MGRKEYNERIQEILCLRNEILSQAQKNKSLHSTEKEEVLNQIEQRISKLRQELEKA